MPLPESPLDTEAVGFPGPVIFSTANFAEVVPVPPARMSSVILVGESAPFNLCQKPDIVPPEIMFFTYRLFHSRFDEDPRLYISVVAGTREELNSPFAVIVLVLDVPRIVLPLTASFP